MAITMAIHGNHKGNNNGHTGNGNCHACNDRWPYMAIIMAIMANTNGNKSWPAWQMILAINGKC